MIDVGLIIVAAGVTAILILLSAYRSGWPEHQTIAAAVISGVAVVAWRLISNALNLNTDFAPTVSIGDAGCLVVGALGPLVIRARHSQLPRAWLLAVVGGFCAFIVNVAIL